MSDNVLHEPVNGEDNVGMNTEHLPAGVLVGVGVNVTWEREGREGEGGGRRRERGEDGEGGREEGGSRERGEENTGKREERRKRKWLEEGERRI